MLIVYLSLYFIYLLNMLLNIYIYIYISHKDTNSE